MRCLLPTRLALLALFIALVSGTGLSEAVAQTRTSGESVSTSDTPSSRPSFGQIHPDAPPETEQYAFMIGVFDCTLAYKTYQDGEWVLEKEGRATWSARYVMDGYGILDEFLDEWGETNINARVFDTERDAWLVHYTTVKPARGAHFEARLVEGRMVMLTERETPNGYAYTDRVAFEPQGPDAYRWTHEIVYPNGSSVVMGDIHCQRR